LKISNYNIIKDFNENILIYNSFSKASFILEKGSDVNMFKDIEAFYKLTDSEQKMLIENGFVIDDNRDELTELKYIYEQKFFETDFLNIILVPTLSCNFKCPYCCEKDFSCGKENIKKYFEVLKKYAEKNFFLHNRVQISLFGGEPLIYIKECLEFLDWVKKDAEMKKYEYFIIVTTNGSLLTKEIFEKLKSHNLYTLQITIDSDKENHDKMRIYKNGNPSFDVLMDKIKNVVHAGADYGDEFKFVLRINLNNTSIEKVRETLNCIDLKNRNKTYLLIRAIYNTHAYNEKNKNNLFSLKKYYDLGTELGFPILKEQYQYQTCESCGDRKMFHLMPDLSVWKCINDIGFEKAKIGKINDDGLIELIPENVIGWYKSCMSAFQDEECVKCKMLPDCLGGCPLYKCKNSDGKSCRSFDMMSLPSLY
jgi:uncharacterized protein